MHQNLRTFLDVLTRENEIITIKAEVDPYLELAEIHRRVIDEGGPALLFARVKGSRYPVVTNLFGTNRRLGLAFGPKPEALVRDFVHVAESILPPRPGELWKHRSLALDFLKLGTTNTGRSPVTQVVDRPARLDQLPVLTTWQEDGGPFVTLPLVYTENPITKKHNLGIYRIQVYDSHTTGLHWQIQKGGGFHYNEAERLNQPLPVTIFLGGPPALILAAIAPLPEDVPLIVAGALIAKGQMNWVVAAICAWCGIIGGDCVLYYMGRRFGLEITRVPFIGKHVTKERIQRVEKLFHRHGVGVVAVGRLVAGIRGAMVVAAGAIRYNFVTFIIADGLAALVSGGLWMWLGHWLGANLTEKRVHELKEWIIAAVALIVVGFIAWMFWKRGHAEKVDEVETKIVERVVSTAEKLPLAKPKEEQTKQMQDAK